MRSHPHEEICQRDGDRLAELQAKPSLDEAVRFGSELRCLKLWPQLQAILDSLSQTAGSAGVSSPNGVAPDTSASETSPPASSSPAMETASGTSDDACKHDEDRLAELQAKPSIDKAMRFGSELRCSKLRPQLLALTGDLASPTLPKSGGAETNATNETPPASEATADADRRIAALERERDALAAEVGRLERQQDFDLLWAAQPLGVAATGSPRGTVRS